MAENVWQTGRLTEVFFPAGRNENDQSPRYQRAPFDILQWKGTNGTDFETYILPLGHEVPNSTALSLAGALDHQVGMEFGFYTGERLYLETSQSGGQDAGWFGCHAFGPI